LQTIGPEVDLAPLLQFTGVLEPLRDPEFFAQVRVNPDIGTMVWRNGANLCPDVLRHHLNGELLPSQTDSAHRAGLTMPAGFTESDAEEAALGWLETLG
jgi:hypothetical protein